MDKKQKKSEYNRKFRELQKSKIQNETVAVDLRKNSKTFGKYFNIKLSDVNGLSIYIPPGFAHGFIGLKDENIVSYHCTNYRSKNNEIGLKWDDKDLNILWPIKNPIISIKDKKNISLQQFININE